MAKKLTPKRQDFVKTYVQEGIASLAVKETFDVTSDGSARSLGSQLLADPDIQEAIEAERKSIADALPDSLLAGKHLALLNKMEVKRTFDHSTGEWIDIHTGQVDTHAVSKGLELAYKVKGSFAPEKSVHVNVEALQANNPKLKALNDDYEEKVKQLFIDGKQLDN